MSNPEAGQSGRYSLAASQEQGRSMLAKDKGGGGDRRPKSRSLSLGRCFSGPPISVPVEKGRKGGLKRLDSRKLKAEIVRWAKAVATYSRQVSGYLAGPPPSRPSERRGHDHVDAEQVQKE